MTDQQALIQTRLDLESARPFVIAAIRRQRLSNTPDPALMTRLRALRDQIDSLIDDLWVEQKPRKDAA